ncbi:hypothetical protein YC2023_108192 [Brassica napus]
MEKRSQRRTGPKFPGKGRQRGWSPVVPGPCRTMRRCLRVGLFGNTAPIGREQVPLGKDEKDFEKRVKEWLKLSGGKRMEAGDSSRSDAERSNPVR